MTPLSYLLGGGPAWETVTFTTQCICELLSGPGEDGAPRSALGSQSLCGLRVSWPGLGSCCPSAWVVSHTSPYTTPSSAGTWAGRGALSSQLELEESSLAHPVAGTRLRTSHSRTAPNTPGAGTAIIIPTLQTEKPRPRELAGNWDADPACGEARTAASRRGRTRADSATSSPRRRDVGGSGSRLTFSWKSLFTCILPVVLVDVPTVCGRQTSRAAVQRGGSQPSPGLSSSSETRLMPPVQMT